MRPNEDTPAHPDTERAATGLAYMLRALDHRKSRRASKKTSELKAPP